MIVGGVCHLNMMLSIISKAIKIVYFYSLFICFFTTIRDNNIPQLAVYNWVTYPRLPFKLRTIATGLIVINKIYIQILKQVGKEYICM